MGVRSGSEYLDHLQSHPREVWVEGQRIEDVTRHPAFGRTARQVARLYDLQSDPQHAKVLAAAADARGQSCATAFLVPKTQQDLRVRRAAFETVAEQTFGLLGRSPDFMNTMLAAFLDGRDYFRKAGARYEDNLVRYVEHVRDNDLFLTHALITPQNDRSKASHEQAQSDLHLGVVRETDEGLIVRGARMLATMGPVADEVLIYSLPMLKPGDERYAVAFALPLSTPGLRQIARPPFEKGLVKDHYEHPLASRFEEPDSLLVFDDVLVPWDRVFINQDVELSNGMYGGTAVRQFTAQQTSVRGLVKLKLVTGAMIAVARAINADIHLHVQNMIGECLDAVEMVESCIVRAELEAQAAPNGTLRPNLRPYHAIRTFLPTIYPRAVEYLQKIGAGGLLMMPAESDFGSPVAHDVLKYYQGAATGSVDRIRIFKLAWDLCGDAFASRQMQYERYYVGDPVRLLASSYHEGNRSACTALVDRAMELAGEPAGMNGR
ncbi:MAG: 4-hydroxyphenylacetate 3-hydroxylase [Bordetella sp. SCN 67-23]|nr:4-hydroxyphenylacetate 3-hydroxylase [Burkholderiales bacterium]ODS69067.1 MAG: 4-hydroxyphenylacetate 3-hydroxylase [Bordetella sp. SCN 67-23]OJW86006.1 MAG: 4-hydroxyphenylacetate 3-hydroxylase [Burkholderiales bacterium 67-32]